MELIDHLLPICLAAALLVGMTSSKARNLRRQHREVAELREIQREKRRQMEEERQRYTR